jgi:hypothetical protein
MVVRTIIAKGNGFSGPNAPALRASRTANIGVKNMILLMITLSVGTNSSIIHDAVMVHLSLSMRTN